MMQQLKSEKLVSEKTRNVKLIDIDALKALAHYQPHELTPIPKVEPALTRSAG
jgi:hypothetical protein